MAADTTPEANDPPGTPISVEGVSLWVRTDPFEGGIDERGRPWRRACYLCKGGDVDTACDRLKGIGTGLYPRPHRYPNNENLICLDVSFKLKGARRKGPKLVTAPYAEIYATYGVPEFDVYGEATSQAFGGLSIPWTTYSIRGTAEVVPWPPAPAGESDLYVFDDPSYSSITPNVKAMDKEVARKDLVIRRSKLPDLSALEAILTPLQGKVNDAAYWGYDRGTLLLRPNDYDTDYDPGGLRLGETTIVLSWREVEHNAVPVPGHFGAFAVVTDPGGTKYRHEYADFSPLFEYLASLP